MSLPNHHRYREYTDEELGAFLETFPDHADRPLAFREQELRKGVQSEVAANDQAQNQHRADQGRPKTTLTQGERIWLWIKVAGIAAVIGTIAVLLLQGTRISGFRRAPGATSPTSATSSPRTMPNDVLSKPSPMEETPLAELLASPTPSPTVAPQ